MNTISATKYISSNRVSDISESYIPIIIPNGTILPGEYWSYQFNLTEGSSYHIYLNGEWTEDVNYETDYDIYLYTREESTFTLLDGFTESAGFPEQISNDNKGHFFIPPKTDSYYISVYNDPKESNSSKEAILNVIESIDTNIWKQVKLEGQVNNKIQYNTYWAFEFNTSQRDFRAIINVPDSLDMYEARIYLMANPDTKNYAKGQKVNGMPLAWSKGLKSDLSRGVGGLNFEPQGYRNPSLVASAQSFGEDLSILYSNNDNTNKLFYLVLMAEEGIGNVEFMVQDNFEPPVITPLYNSSIITYSDLLLQDYLIESIFNIKTILINYTTNNITYFYDSKFDFINNDAYRYYFIDLKTGDFVTYKIVVIDELNQYSTYVNSFKIMDNIDITYTLSDEEIMGDENIYLEGYANHRNITINIVYNNYNNMSYKVVTEKDGYFNHTFHPNKEGIWFVQLLFEGNDNYFKNTSNIKQFKVMPHETELLIDIKRKNYYLGENINIQGYFSYESLGKEIILNIYHEGNVTQLLSITSPQGNYEASFEPKKLGEYSIVATVKDNIPVYHETISNTIYINIKKSYLPIPIRRLFDTILSSSLLYIFMGLLPVSIGGIILYRKYSE